MDQKKETMKEPTLEVELKYACSKEDLEKVKILPSFLGQGLLEDYFCDKVKEKERDEVYYDTEDFLLEKNHCCFRSRPKGKKYRCTVKCPVDGRDGEIFVRQEEDKKIAPCPDGSFDVEAGLQFAEKYLPMLEGQTVVPVLIVKKKRTSFYIGQKESIFYCDLALDEVVYVYNGQEKVDYQIEMELKGESESHPDLLLVWAKALIATLSLTSLTLETVSKYEKALSLFKNR